jgi:hypothetical protein
MSKISIITLMPKHSFNIYRHFHSDFFTSKLTLKKTETIKTRKQYKMPLSFTHLLLNTTNNTHKSTISVSTHNHTYMYIVN